MNEEKRALLTIGDKQYDLPIIVGSENEHGIDIRSLRQDSGCITFDPGYGNTGSCQSSITYVNGEEGALHYRGYPLEELAEHSTFIETAMLLIFGKLPTRQERMFFRNMLAEEELLHEDLLHHFNGFPPNGHPMAILSAIINSLGCYHPDLLEISDDTLHRAVAKIISQVRTIAAFAYKKSIGQPIMYPDPTLSYCMNFLHMMFSIPYKHYEPPPAAVEAVELFFIVHADHEQNCSASTVRMVGSSQANLFASISAGICALWGRLHGGANSAVMQMLDEIRERGIGVKDYLERVKKQEFLLMGFGHRVYKSFDPRAKIMKRAAHNLLGSMGGDDEIIHIAQQMEEAALSDDYFVSRKLYPNVDFYSGIILRALGIPVQMFPVMFAIGRMPGWIAHWYEELNDPQTRIHRPRQIYTGPTRRQYIPIDER
ncbi:MAG: citrate synthase [Desulfovibrionales bacterium]|jgi:citrate synthase|nr:citrate synthase [Desulfovibrionales bacterium]